MTDSPKRSSILQLPAALVGQVLLGLAVGAACGVGGAAFLWLLGSATAVRVVHVELVWLLPLAGLAMGVALQRYGEPVRSGTNLVIWRARDGGERLPRRMAPIIVLGTVWTHLFGGSAGREGTAVQMGAGLAEWLHQGLGLNEKLRPLALQAGVAGGFGAVFGTPVAAAVFAMEWLVRGQLAWRTALPGVIAAFSGNAVAHALGAHHMVVAAPEVTPLTGPLIGMWVVLAGLIVATTRLFIILTRWMRDRWVAAVASPPWRLFWGGVAVVALWQLAGTDDYLGLGVPFIVRAFEDPDLPAQAFAWKMVFTAVTLSAGYLGGEVTPLFFMGAALGSVFATVAGIPVALGAGVGMAAMFATAAHTPLALSLMAAEVVGMSVMPHVIIVCLLCRVLAGSDGIYSAQVAPAPQPVEPAPEATPDDRPAHPQT